MSALSIQPTFPIFTETDGQPLENGYIWIGTANLDPQVNPINVYWDAALTIAAPQPIRTINGYQVNNGTPARLYVDSDYSIRVLNKNGSVVYSAPSATERYSDVVIDFTRATATGNGTQTNFAVAVQPNFIYINGVYQNSATFSYVLGDVIFSEAPPLNAVIEFVS